MTNGDERADEISSNIESLLSSMEVAPGNDLSDSVARERSRNKTIWVAIVIALILLQVVTLAASFFINRQLTEAQVTQSAASARIELNEAALNALQEANDKLIEQGKTPIPIPESTNGEPVNTNDIVAAAAKLVINQLPATANSNPETITGPTGPTGLIGPPGPSGAPGQPGTNGLDGFPGSSITGPPGASGLPGSNGQNGVDGTSGTSGTSGLNGLDGLNGANGTDGVSVSSAAITNCHLILTFSNGVTSDLGNVCGTNGTNGTNGVDGAPGANGADGAVGPQGPQGDPGPQGDVGPQGPPGDVVTVTETIILPPGPPTS